MSSEGQTATVLHAGCVSLSGRGVLILGPSGSGKSALALELLAMGCMLVSDDRTSVALREDILIASAPAAIAGRIEARGVGILAAEQAPAAPLVLAVDLGRTEDARLPPHRVRSFMGIDLPLLHRVESAHFPAAILQYLKAGRIE